MKKAAIILFSALLVTGIYGCARESGPLESAGERADEITDNIAEGRSPLHKKGPLEKAGESVDESLNGE